MLHGFGFIGLVGLISKLHKWDESAMFFDGSCIGAYGSPLGNSDFSGWHLLCAFV